MNFTNNRPKRTLLNGTGVRLMKVAGLRVKDVEFTWHEVFCNNDRILDEEMAREYIRNQEKEDEYYDQLKLGM